MLLSRVADSLYWISRYLERAEHTARLLDVRLDLGLDRRRGDEAWHFERLYAALRLQPPADVADLGPASLVDALMFDTANRDSVLSCVTSARENARQVREEISSDMWEQINAPLPATQAGAARTHVRWRGRTTCRAWSSKASISSRASPTRRWATAKGGSTCRSAGSSSARATTAALLDLHCHHWCGSAVASRDRVGRAAAIVLGARGVLPVLHRRPPAATGSSSSCC